MTCPFQPPRHEQCANAYECHTCERMRHKDWCAILCSQCALKHGCTCGAREAASRRSGQKIDLWNTPTTSSGKFWEAKQSGDIFYGVSAEDAFVQRFNGDFDSLHVALGVIATLAIVGLFLHAMGVFIP